MMFKPRNAKFTGPIIGCVALLVLVALYVLVVMSLPYVSPTMSVKNINVTAQGDAITWPNYGEEAIGVSDGGVLETNGAQTEHPIASIAKLMLAYLVVQQKPLQPGQTGPTLTMTQSDVDLYTNYLKQNGSVVPVSLDEKISEYQMLQALLLPSGDNIADSLAIWAYGSTANYLTTANQEASKLGLAQTHFDDACGLSPNTVSSAQNLVVLGSLVLNEPILADIVGQSEVTLPVAGMEHNVDSLLGKNGIIGIKTGNTDEAGGCFLFAVKESVGSSSYTTIGAILGSTGLNSVLADTTAFLQNNPTAVTEISPVSQGQVVGSYTTAWGQSITAIAKSDLLVYVAGNQHVVVKVSLDKITQPTKEGTVVGKITAQTGQSTVSVPAVLASSLTRPRITWQLLHP